MNIIVLHCHFTVGAATIAWIHDMSICSS